MSTTTVRSLRTHRAVLRDWLWWLPLALWIVVPAVAVGLLGSWMRDREVAACESRPCPAPMQARRIGGNGDCLCVVEPGRAR